MVRTPRPGEYVVHRDTEISTVSRWVAPPDIEVHSMDGRVFKVPSPMELETIDVPALEYGEDPGTWVRRMDREQAVAAYLTMEDMAKRESYAEGGNPAMYEELKDVVWKYLVAQDWRFFRSYIEIQ